MSETKRRRTPPGERTAVVGRAGDRFEREAERAADRVAAGGAAGPISAVTTSALQRAVEKLEQEDQPVQAAGLTEEEEEPVQAAGQTEEEEPVQAAATTDEKKKEEEKPVQAAGVEEEEEPVQAARAGPSAPTVSVPAPRGGRPLAPATRSRVESGLGSSLGHVRVHDDGAARAATKAMGARAFTHGSDIWLGPGESDRDTHLMAHEATHVVQQAGGSPLVQRTTQPTTIPPPTTNTPPPAGSLTVGDDEIDVKNKTIKLGLFQLPEFKAKLMTAPIEFDFGKERKTDQGTEWEKLVKGGATKAATDYLAGPGVAKNTAGTYFLRHKNVADMRVIGDEKDVQEAAMAPFWDKDGLITGFHIDHIREWQLGGEDKEDNFWLLEQRANTSSGSKISIALTRRVNSALRGAAKANVPGTPADADAIRNGTWKIQMPKFGDQMPITTGRPDSRWTLKQIKEGAALSALKPMDEKEMTAAGGSKQTLKIYFSPAGGRSSDVKWGVDGTRTMTNWWFGREEKATAKKSGNLAITQITYVPGGAANKLSGTAFEREEGKIGPQPVPVDIALVSKPGLDWTGFMDGTTLFQQTKNIIVPGASPVELDEQDLTPDKGLVARGRLAPTIPLIANAEIDVVVDGDDLYLSKIFSSGDFSFPGPVKIDEATLEFQLGLKGFSVLGEVGFSITNVGKGVIKAATKANLDSITFALEGEFNFLSDLFDPAKVSIWYRDEQLGGRGEVAVKPGAVKGLKSASAVVTWEQGVIAASGKFAPEIPGIKEGSLDFRYGEDGTMSIAGMLLLSGDIPGIKSGQIDARVERDEASLWHVRGVVTAVPSIPGIAATVTGTYDDGAFLVNAIAAYDRGMASGSLTIGLTNQAVDPESGKPGGEPTEHLTAFGGGTVSLTLAPWLKATAGLRLLPNGEIEVSGEIGLPSSLQLFALQPFEKNLVSIAIDIPILGIAAAGQRIGIFATIGGGIDVHAGIGPGTLENLRLGITWNPDHEEQTTVTGGAGLRIPASAGIRLSIHGGLGAGIPIVSATLGLEVGGELGIAGALTAELAINWTPTTGLMLDTVVEAAAEPRFTFDVTGFAKVELDLLLKTITLFEERWVLAKFQYGSGLRLGLRFPLHYQEGQPFAPSLDDIEFQVPQIDVPETMAALVKQIM